MFAPPLAPSGPWTIDLVVVAGNAWSGAERRAISRDVERGLLLRLMPGVYVDRLAFRALSPEGRHLVRMRAVQAVSRGPVLFSHWSAAVLHGLPVVLERLDSVHVTIAEDDDRHRVGVSAHRFLVEDDEAVRFGALTATGVGRTVVDVAGAAPLEEGVMAADGALLAGVPRALLEAAVDLAGPRRASRRTVEAIGMAHPGAESAAESRMRVALMRAGFEVPELQHPVRLRSGSTVFLDALLPIARAGIEVDGRAKYLDPSMAPDGAGAAVLAEKDREDEVRLALRSLVRPGWHQTGGPAAMRSLLGRVGVMPTRPRTPMTEYAAAARSAHPRAAPAHASWRA